MRAKEDQVVLEDTDEDCVDGVVGRDVRAVRVDDCDAGVRVGNV